MNESEKIINKYKELKAEVTEYLRSQGETQIEYSSNHVRMLVETGLLPKEVGEWFFKDNEEKRKQHEKWQEFIKNNPDIPKGERGKRFFKEGPLSPDESVKVYEEMALSGQLMMCLLKNRHLIDKDSKFPTTTTQKLFENIDIAEEFGIANCIANSLYHLESLLKNMELKNLRGKMYEARSSIKNKNAEAISLTYTFQSSTGEEAEKILKEYKSTMIGKGLKVLLSYWMMANKVGRVEYSCAMIDTMKLIADEERESFFSVKEKEEYWSLTKMLSLSKLTREKKVKKRGTKREAIRWIEQELVRVVGGEKELAEIEKYPTDIAVQVLMPLAGKKGFAPIAYKNSTKLLSPSDMLLGFMLQTRAGQMGRGSKDLHFDWDFIFEAGNLQITAQSNQRGAKAKARKKMDRIQEGEIIEKME